MVDIHSHILPGLDDGSQTLEDSVAMLRQAAEAGTTGSWSAGAFTDSRLAPSASTMTKARARRSWATREGWMPHSLP